MQLSMFEAGCDFILTITEPSDRSDGFLTISQSKAFVLPTGKCMYLGGVISIDLFLNLNCNLE